LVLDEPTNDLDIETLELLEELLQDYSGTLFLVATIAPFLDNLVTQDDSVRGRRQAGRIRRRLRRLETCKTISRRCGRVKTGRTTRPAKPAAPSRRRAAQKAEPKRSARNLRPCPIASQHLRKEQAAVSQTPDRRRPLPWTSPRSSKCCRRGWQSSKPSLCAGTARWEELETRNSEAVK